ncbi:MAG TPA: recombinase family protein [Geminicoccaceae bacterium]|nr:recombinase family protein [Geminicoccaceae bacterium]
MSANACALYLRSSKDRHDVSIDAQRRELLELAAGRSLTVAREYADAVEAANDWSRPGFRALLRDVAIAERGWSVLLVLDTSRLARDVNLAGVFRHECRRRGIKLLFAKIPESNPLADLITTHVYQLVDHIHSHMSREKGLAGMAENVKKGFRAGGSAPIGYQLERVATGAMRDGAPVTKSRLVPGPDAPAIARYLEGRGRGEPGAPLARRLGLQLSQSSLTGLEWNALTYAGHTVWNVHRGRGVGAGGYEGGTKRRPRAEWVIQRDTHAALVGDDVAERILARLEAGKARRTRGADYLLSGILEAPDGARWWGDAGFYRCGRRRLARENLERQVLEAIGEQLASPAIVRQAVEVARRLARADDAGGELQQLQRQAAELERKIGRTRNLLPEMKHPEALLPKLDALQEEKAAIDARAAALVAQATSARVVSMVTEADVQAVLAGFVGSLAGLERPALKAQLRHLVERVTIDPATLKCCLYYAIPTGTGVSVASPRGAELNPALRIRRSLALTGFRRAA